MRVYSPSVGRFLTRDPIGEAGGLDTYEYAKNDPINYSDPSGMAPAPVAVDRSNEAPSYKVYNTMTSAQMSAAGLDEGEIGVAYHDATYVPTLAGQLKDQGLDPTKTLSTSVTAGGKTFTYYSDGNKSVYALSLGWVGQTPVHRFTIGIFGDAKWVTFGVEYFNNFEAARGHIDAELYTLMHGAVAGLVIASEVPNAVTGVATAVGRVGLLSSQINRAQQQLQSMPTNPNAAKDLAGLQQTAKSANDLSREISQTAKDALSSGDETARDALTAEQRATAANNYRQIGNMNTNTSNANIVKGFQNARADWLEGKGPWPGNSANAWAKANGIQ